MILVPDRSIDFFAVKPEFFVTGVSIPCFIHDSVAKYSLALRQSGMSF